jgi:hypothetical protein
MFAPKGAPDRPAAHKMSKADIDGVRMALAELTPLQRRVLQQHLAILSFADGMPNTALTYPATNRHGFFNITVRSGVFHETISQLLNKKENSCFANEDAENRVVIDAGNMPALTYVLLHESTHVVDASVGLAEDTAKANGLQRPVGSFMDGVWASWNTPVPNYNDPLLQVACYHRNGRTPDIRGAPSVYQALSRTPFPSLYATASVHEYVAELEAWGTLSKKLHQPYKITVYLKGRPAFIFEPESGDLVKREESKTSILL